MIPQRLEPVKGSPEILTAPNIAGLEIDCRTEQNADEIRKRYNGYFDQQARIEQWESALRDIACNSGPCAGTNHTEALYRSQEVAKAALAVAKEKK